MRGEEVHLYWATGCSSCLNAKEFLERNAVPFISHNVIEDQSGLDELEEMGLPRYVPFVVRDGNWANGQILTDVAKLVGVDHTAEILPVIELYDRLNTVLELTHYDLEVLPRSHLDDHIPGRPRSYGELIFHIFGISESFIEHETDIPLKGWKSVPDWDELTKDRLRSYGDEVDSRLTTLMDEIIESRDWSAQAEVYYGTPTVHEFFERITWHSGQHLRQLQWILETELEISLPHRADEKLWKGLPMPDKVWDIEKK